ncbi:hypothetical protein ACX80Z_09655 [Arthrobacter sp. TMT4-20]
MVRARADPISAGYFEQETPIVPGTIRDNRLLTHPDATDDETWDALRAVWRADQGQRNPQ